MSSASMYLGRFEAIASVLTMEIAARHSPEETRGGVFYPCSFTLYSVRLHDRLLALVACVEAHFFALVGIVGAGRSALLLRDFGSATSPLSSSSSPPSRSSRHHRSSSSSSRRRRCSAPPTPIILRRRQPSVP